VGEAYFRLENWMRAAIRRAATLGLVVGIAAVASAQDAPPIARYVPGSPDPAHVFVLDSAHLLSPQTLQALQDSARALQTETAADVAWVTLPTLGGRPIEEAALYIGRTWRIGSAGQAGDPLRNRGLVILYVPDKTKTAGPNFRVEVGNGLEGTITDSRSRAISLAMRDELRAKHYDAAYMAGWGVAAALVRTDFASHDGSAQKAAITAAAAARPRANVQQLEPHGVNPIFPALILVVIVGLLILLALSWWRAARAPASMFQVRGPLDDEETRRRNNWFSSSSSGTDFSSGGDSGGSSSSDGGSFGDGGGFSGGGSSDTI
jgi:uncharacterized protein